MSWTAAIMPDDALGPASLVGSILNPKPLKEDGQTFNKVPAIKEPPPATAESMPLWRVMDKAANPFHFANTGTHGEIRAAEIEALRDWLLPVEPEPPLASDGSQRLRALLTEQARIARGDSDD